MEINNNNERAIRNGCSFFIVLIFICNRIDFLNTLVFLPFCEIYISINLKKLLRKIWQKMLTTYNT